MRALVLLLCMVTLAGCSASVTVRAADGSETVLPAEIYAHQLSVQAYGARAADSSACYNRATTDLGLAVCGLAARGGGGGADQVPVYRPGPNAWDRVLGTVQAVTPLAMGFMQYRQAQQSSELAYRTSVELAAISAAREGRTVEAFAGMGAAGFGALQASAASSHNALAHVAGEGFVALERLGDSAIGSAEASTEAWARMVGDLRPTYQAGGDLVLAGGDVDQSTVAGHRVTGEGNEVGTTTVTECTTEVAGGPTTSTAGTSGSASAAGGTTGSPGSSVPGQASSSAAPGALTGTTLCTPRGG